jgi:hypothetical protein
MASPTCIWSSIDYLQISGMRRDLLTSDISEKGNADSAFPDPDWAATELRCRALIADHGQVFKGFLICSYSIPRASLQALVVSKSCHKGTIKEKNPVAKWTARQFNMDIAKCALISILESYASHAYVGEPHMTRGQIELALILFAVQYLFVKAFNIFIYPHYFSPLRSIPGPEVSLSCVNQGHRLTFSGREFLPWPDFQTFPFTAWRVRIMLESPVSRCTTHSISSRR